MKYLIAILSPILLVLACTSTPVPNPKNSLQANNPVVEKKTKKSILSVKSKFLDHGPNIRIMLNYELEPSQNSAKILQDFGSNYVLSFTLLPDYSSKQSLNSGVIELSSQRLYLNNKTLTVVFDIPKPKDIFTGIVMSSLSEKTGNVLGLPLVNDLFVRFQSGKVGDYFTFFEKNNQSPILRNYADKSDSIIIKDLANTSRKMMVLRYKHDFDFAQSPMATTPRSVTKALYLDSLFYVETNKPFMLNEEALYYFCRDTTESYGIGILGVDGRFPRLTRPERMTRPLAYMSTLQEMADWGKAGNTEEAKRAIDRFFLTLTNGNQQVAKRIIKQYYQRIEQANELYTTYKEGWKTDRGMIFTIMGEADRVLRSKDKEVWTYNRRGQAGDINFTFLRRPNQFVEDHYELTRYPEYQALWFPIVESWRIGEAGGN